MACELCLRELIIFTPMYHIVAINDYKCIKLIGNNRHKKIIDAKYKQNYNLSTSYTSEGKQVWRYCNNNDYKIRLTLLPLKQRGEL